MPQGPTFVDGRRLVIAVPITKDVWRCLECDAIVMGEPDDHIDTHMDDGLEAPDA